MTKYLVLITLLTCGFGRARAAGNSSVRDTVVITVGQKARIIVQADSREELRKLLRYDLNAVLRDMGAKIDSTEGKEARIVFDDVSGSRYLKDTVITVTTDDRLITITVNREELKRARSGADTTTRNPTPARRSSRRWYNNADEGFMFGLGLDAFDVKDYAGYAPDELTTRNVPWKFVTLGFAQSPVLIPGARAALTMRVGVDVSWYNFMFEGNRFIEKGPERVQFPLSATPLSRSKLTVSYLDFSLTPKLVIRRGFISHIAAGGYVGYRIGSYARLRREDGRLRDRTNFYLTDLRYGWSAELGFRKFPDLFFQYDLNPLFRAGRGPEINAFSLGFRLLTM